MTPEKIFDEVKATLIEALNADDDAVTPAARLQADLGAESIDFLDIVFRLERAFGIKIPRGELFPESIFQGDAALVQDGKVTAKGLDELRKAMPFADPAELDKFAANPILDSMGDLFTVNLICRYIAMKLNK
jgi:acyl carrier protein